MLPEDDGDDVRVRRWWRDEAPWGMARGLKSVDGGDDYELVEEIELVAVAAEPAQGLRASAVPRRPGGGWS